MTPRTFTVKIPLSPAHVSAIETACIHRAEWLRNAITNANPSDKYTMAHYKEELARTEHAQRQVLTEYFETSNRPTYNDETPITQEETRPANLTHFQDLTPDAATDALRYMASHSSGDIPITEYYFHTRKDGRLNNAYKWPAKHQSEVDSSPSGNAEELDEYQRQANERESAALAATAAARAFDINPSPRGYCVTCQHGSQELNTAGLCPHCEEYRDRR